MIDDEALPLMQVHRTVAWAAPGSTVPSKSPGGGFDDGDDLAGLPVRCASRSFVAAMLAHAWTEGPTALLGSGRQRPVSRDGGTVVTQISSSAPDNL